MKSLEKYRNKQGKLWLNVGAGGYPMPDFINIDNSIFLQLLKWYPILKRFIGKRRCACFDVYKEALKVAPYLIFDCGKPLPLPTASVDHILTSHFLEHLHHDEAEKVVRGFHRILKTGGTLHVIVPDLAHRAVRYVGKIGSVEAASELMESLWLTTRERPSFLLRWREFVGGFGMIHHWMYDETSMVTLLEKGGFSIAAENSSPSAAWRREDNDSQVNLLAVKY